jgi:hypothetical protein
MLALGIYFSFIARMVCIGVTRAGRDRKRRAANSVFPSPLALAGAVLWLFSIVAADPSLAVEPRAGLWSAGVGVGVLGDTPQGTGKSSDTAFAFNLYVDRFIDPNVSLGPLLQVADFSQVALSLQPKYWLDVALPNPGAKMNFQAGLGFFHAEGETSFVIPIGIGVDYPINRIFSFTMTILLNFTGIDAGLGSGVHLMPGLTLGVRF